MMQEAILVQLQARQLQCHPAALVDLLQKRSPCELYARGSNVTSLGRAGPSVGLSYPVFTAEPQSLWQKVLPTGRTLSRTPSTLLLEPGKPATGIYLRAAVLPGVAEHVREAGEDMTNGRTLLGRFCREHCSYRDPGPGPGTFRSA